MKTNNSLQKLPLLALCLGFFMVILDASIINVALPTLSTSLNAKLANLQWIMAGYTLTFSCFLLFAGYLADQMNPKRILLVGLIFFACASLACGLSTSIIELIIFRLIQGAAAAILVPSSLKLLHITYSNSKERTKAIGIWGGLAGVAAATGPIIGAWLTENFGWSSLFLINVPIAAITIFLVAKFLKPSKPSTKKKFDSMGQLFGLILVASLTSLIIYLGRHSIASKTSLIMLSIFISSTLIFLLIETHNKHPMMPLRFFKNKDFSLATLMGFIINLGLYGTLFLLPIYFQQYRHYSTEKTGMAILPLMILVSISSFLSGKLASHKGAKLPIRIGFLIGMLGFSSLFSLQDHTPHYAYLILPLMAIGFGVSFIMPAATVIAIDALPKQNSGTASGIFITSRQLGSLIGVTLFGSLISHTSGFVHGSHIAMLIAACLFFIGFLLNHFTVNKNPLRHKRG